MNILILNHYGRLSPRVQEEIRTLSENGYRIHVLLWVRDDNVQQVVEGATSVHRVVLRTPKRPLKVFLRLPFVYLLMFRRIQRVSFDFIHCTHLMLLPLAVYMRTRRGKKVIYDAYEFYLQHALSKRGMLASIVRKLRHSERFLVRRTDGVLTIDSRNDLLTKYYSSYSDNVKVLYNVPNIRCPIDAERLDCLKKEFKQRRVITYVGGLSEAKGAIKAVETAAVVARRIPRSLFLFIGIFHRDSTEGDFWSRVSLYGLSDHVKYIPWLPYREMLPYLSISEIGLSLHQPIPRFNLVSKGNGRKFFTYMQAGLPVIAPNFGEVARVVEEERAGILVDTTDPQKIADSIMYLLTHPEEKEQMGINGKRAVEERYNWQRESQKLIEVYQSA